MTNQTSIKYISDLLEHPDALADSDQSSIALFRQEFPYFVPVRYLSALEAHRKSPFSAAMMSHVLPYMGNWMLFCEFLQDGLQGDTEVAEEAGQDEPGQEATPAAVTVVAAEIVAASGPEAVREEKKPAPRQEEALLPVAAEQPRQEATPAVTPVAATPAPTELVTAKQVVAPAPAAAKVAKETAAPQAGSPLAAPAPVAPEPKVAAPQAPAPEPVAGAKAPEAPVVEPIPPAFREYRPVEPMPEPVAAAPVVTVSPPVTAAPVVIYEVPPVAVAPAAVAEAKELSPVLPVRVAIPNLGSMAAAAKEGEKIKLRSFIVPGKVLIGEPGASPLQKVQAALPSPPPAASEAAPAQRGEQPAMPDSAAQAGIAAGKASAPPREDKGSPEQAAGPEPAVLIQPVYAEDYFLHQGLSVSSELPVEIPQPRPEFEKVDKSLMVMMSFTEWLLHFKHTSDKQKEEKKDQKSLRTMWQKEKLAAAIEEENEEIPENVFEMAVTSITKEDGLASESLADIYIKQGKYDRAIEMYRKLSLRNPKKNAYFARKIEEVLKEKQS